MDGLTYGWALSFIELGTDPVLSISLSGTRYRYRKEATMAKKNVALDTAKAEISELVEKNKQI